MGLFVILMHTILLFELIAPSSGKFESSELIVKDEITPAKLENYQYIVAVYTGGLFKGSGMVLNRRWIVTVAHIIKSDAVIHVEVSAPRLGIGTFYPSEFTYVHSLFNATTLAYDIGLVRICEDFVFGPALKPVVIDAHPCAPYHPKKALVAFWAETRYGSELKQRQTLILQAKKCPVKSGVDLLRHYRICAPLSQPRRRGQHPGAPVVDAVSKRVLGMSFQRPQEADSKGEEFIKLVVFTEWISKIIYTGGFSQPY